MTEGQFVIAIRDACAAGGPLSAVLDRLRATLTPQELAQAADIAQVYFNIRP